MDRQCLICNEPATVHERGVIRGRHEGIFLRCISCGFIFVESPNWLLEAYAEPINAEDTGYAERNLWCREQMRAFIEMFRNPVGKFVDYAGGYGLFVRLMRDCGYDFYWSDLFCPNLFARGFEAGQSNCQRFEAVTAFEVFEHWTDPKTELAKLADSSDCVVFSTRLVPNPAPALRDWWYYGIEHGQHVSFYTAESLDRLARQFDFHFNSDGEVFHAFSRAPLSQKNFKRLRSERWKRWLKRRCTLSSRTESDHHLVKAHMVKDFTRRNRDNA